MKTFDVRLRNLTQQYDLVIKNLTTRDFFIVHDIINLCSSFANTQISKLIRPISGVCSLYGDISENISNKFLNIHLGSNISSSELGNMSITFASTDANALIGSSIIIDVSIIVHISASNSNSISSSKIDTVKLVPVSAQNNVVISSNSVESSSHKNISIKNKTNFGGQKMRLSIMRDNFDGLRLCDIDNEVLDDLDDMML